MTDSLQRRRAAMIVELRRQGINDERALAALGAVRRELFVRPEFAQRAYENVALPIDEDQTISQPTIVGLMTQALALTGSEAVLEIGAGSGYQCAVLARLARQVDSVERIESLAHAAEARLRSMQVMNVRIHVGDGSLGWPEFAPYDAILVTAAAPELPAALLAQLRPTGRLVAPVGDRHSQHLILVEQVDGVRTESFLCGCRFVPLVGDQGWPLIP